MKGRSAASSTRPPTKRQNETLTGPSPLDRYRTAATKPPTPQLVAAAATSQIPQDLPAKNAKRAENTKNPSGSMPEVDLGQRPVSGSPARLAGGGRGYAN